MNILFENTKLAAGFLVLGTSLFIFKRRFLSGVKYISNNRLDGKLVIVTGANSGIGYATAIDLACRGAIVILACRNEKQAIMSVNSIRKNTQNQNVFYEHIDLESLDSVRQFSKKILATYNRIDILINNAGLNTSNDFILQPIDY